MVDNIFIDFSVTIDKIENDSTFMDINKDTIISILKEQGFDEMVNSYSYEQYKALMYHSAYNYCLFLFFLILNTLEDEYIVDSESRCKKVYQFRKVQTNLAHIGIDLDNIYNTIVINYIPVIYEQ